MKGSTSSEHVIKFHPEFFADVKKLNKADKSRVYGFYKKIKQNPLRQKHMSGGANCYTVRAGSLRVIYYVEGKTVWLLIADNRDKIYEEHSKRLHSLRFRYGFV